MTKAWEAQNTKRLVAQAQRRAAKLTDRELIDEAGRLTIRFGQFADPLDSVLGNVYMDEYKARG